MTNAAYLDRLLENLTVTDKSNLLIICDNSTYQWLGHPLLQRALPEDAELLNLDSSYRPLPQELPGELIGIIENALPEEDMYENVSLLAVKKVPHEEAGKKALKDLLLQRSAMAGLPNITPEAFDHVFSVGLDHQFIDRLFDYLQNVEAISVSSNNGTHLAVTFNTPTYRWVKSNGIVVPGNYRNPIGAEVYTHPESVDGQFVIDGLYSGLLTADPYREHPELLVEALAKTPVVWNIKRGKIVDVTCNDAAIQQVARDYVFGAANADCIGEFAIPANLGLLAKQLIGNLLVDEKARFHMANGDGYQESTGCKYTSINHGDGLLQNASIRNVDNGDYIMLNNSFNKQLFGALKN